MFLLTTDKFAMAVQASEFNDKPEGGGGDQQSTPKMLKHRRLSVQLRVIFLPRMSNEVACRFVIKLAEGLVNGGIYWQAGRSSAAIQTLPIST